LVMHDNCWMQVAGLQLMTFSFFLHLFCTTLRVTYSSMSLVQPSHTKLLLLMTLCQGCFIKRLLEKIWALTTTFIMLVASVASSNFQWLRQIFNRYSEIIKVDYPFDSFNWSFYIYARLNWPDPWLHCIFNRYNYYPVDYPFDSFNWSLLHIQG
jgi:hypothetical protein